MAGEAGRLKRIALVVAALACCAATGASSPVTELAGRYYASHNLQMYGVNEGEKYIGEDVVEIVPVSPDAAYFRAHLDFDNGHICAMWGVAKAEASSLVYNDPADPPAGRSRCILTITRTGHSLRLDDGPDHACSVMYCGARGDFGNTTLPWSSKRPITYMARLKKSEQYQDALTEWRTGKPAN